MNPEKDGRKWKQENFAQDNGKTVFPHRKLL